LVVESTLQNSARAFLDLYSECTVSLRLLKGHILAGTMATVHWLQNTGYRTLATVATVLAIQWLQYTSYSTIAGTMATVH
jgi:transcriptional regulator GlxA family with amidase domain